MDSQIVVDALYYGGAYALIALGMTVIYQPTRIINFAQGEAFVLGAAVGFQVIGLWQGSWAAAILATLVAAVVLGVVTERLIMVPVRRSGSKYAWLVATLAVALILESVFALTYPEGYLSPAALLPGDLTLGPVVIAWQKLLVIVAAVVIMVAYDQFLRRTPYGRAIRATSFAPDTALLMGIPVKRVVLLSFIIASVITSFAGLLAAPVFYISAAGGLLFTIKGFIAAVIGGVGSPTGALLGGLIVGTLDVLVPHVFGGSNGNFYVFGALVLILVLFPRGLIARTVVASR